MLHSTHDRLVSTAVRLFRERGYPSTSITDVFEAAADVTDPIEKVFSLLARYRQFLVKTDCRYDSPMGGLALEIHEPDSPIRELLAAYFQAFTDAVLECFLEADLRLPDALDRLSLAEFVLTTVEGASMQVRTFRDVAYFDRAVQELRNYVELLLYGRPNFTPAVRQALLEIGGPAPSLGFAQNRPKNRSEDS